MVVSFLTIYKMYRWLVPKETNSDQLYFGDLSGYKRRVDACAPKGKIPCTGASGDIVMQMQHQVCTTLEYLVAMASLHH